MASIAKKTAKFSDNPGPWRHLNGAATETPGWEKRQRIIRLRKALMDLADRIAMERIVMPIGIV